jgi:hypothetical protein
MIPTQQSPKELGDVAVIVSSESLEEGLVTGID